MVQGSTTKPPATMTATLTATHTTATTPPAADGAPRSLPGMLALLDARLAAHERTQGPTGSLADWAARTHPGACALQVVLDQVFATDMWDWAVLGVNVRCTQTDPCGHHALAVFYGTWPGAPRSALCGVKVPLGDLRGPRAARDFTRIILAGATQALEFRR